MKSVGRGNNVLLSEETACIDIRPNLPFFFHIAISMTKTFMSAFWTKTQDRNHTLI